MKHDILPLAQKGHTAKEIASQLGLPLSTVYYHLRKARSDPPPQPPAYRNLWRNALVQKTYELVRDRQMPYETAARLVIEKCHPERLACASGDPRPVTPRRLAAWTKPPMTESQKLAEELGISLRAAQHRLKKNRPPPPPPPEQANVFRGLLVGQVYELVVCKGLPYETAARRIIEKYPPEFLDRASGDPRPVTPRRLAAWTKPK